MKRLDLTDVTEYVESHIEAFYRKRIERLDELQLKTVLKKKNPYLFKAKHLLTAGEIVKGITAAFISSNEETIFGDRLEGLAIFINQKVYNGWKSGIQNVDLEFDKGDIRYIVNIKSGPNWGNSSRISKMKSDFKAAIRKLRTGNSNLMVMPINGCCYRMDNKPDKGDYYKYCGPEFWEFISGNDELYTEIIEPLGYKSKERNDDFAISYSKMCNRFTKEFIHDFCSQDGGIDWVKFVRFNSGNRRCTC
ncbi:MAG: PmeII family type II restriction endonuclease [Flavobacteriales bacterium]